MERPTASAATTALAPAQPRYRRVPLEPLASGSLHLQKLRVPRGARRLRIHRPRKALRDELGAFMAGVACDVGRSLLLYWLRARWNGWVEGGGGSRIFSRSGGRLWIPRNGWRLLLLAFEQHHHCCR